MLSVIIPAYNEAEIIEHSVNYVHEYMQQRGLTHEVIVVSNGSTDGTDDICRRLAGENRWFRFFITEQRGPGRAFAKGVREAAYEYVVSLDADMAFELRFIDYSVSLLEHGAMLVGSKSMGRQQRSLLRVFASQTYILCTQILFGTTISDYSIGCKAFRRSAILPVLEHIDSWTGYILELCVFLTDSGQDVLQIGVNCFDNRASHFNLFHEGYFRFYHLYRVSRMRKDPQSWLRKAVLAAGSGSAAGSA